MVGTLLPGGQTFPGPPGLLNHTAPLEPVFDGT